MYYLPLAQAPEDFGRAGVVVIRTRPELVSGVSAAVARGMAGSFGFPVTTRVQGMSATLRREYHQWKLGAALFSAAGLIALLVAGVGIYSTIACIVGQRRHEIGVRIALGAQSLDVARHVTFGALVLVGLGLVAGIGGGVAFGRLIGALLFQVTPTEPGALVRPLVLLAFVFALASLPPVIRAVRTDPVETLRND